MSRWQSIDKALATLLKPSESQFYMKYLTNTYDIHDLKTIKRFKAAIKAFLSTKLDEKRTLHALHLQEYLLTENDMDDFYEFVKFLSSKELEARFWKQYRDHTAHQVLCFLLGAYIYENSHPLREIFENEYRSGPAATRDPVRTGFYYQWSTASLLHDFGYFLDVEKAGEKEASEGKIRALRTFFERLDEYFQQYLSEVYRLHKGSEPSTSVQEKLLLLQNLLTDESTKHQYHDKRDYWQLGEFFGDKGIAKKYSNAWQLLNDFALKKDVRFKDVVENYFRILATHGAPYAERPIEMWDHGIASGILFLKLSVFAFSYFKALMKIGSVEPLRRTVGEVAEEVVEMVRTWDYTEEAFWGSLVPACFAMVVHNLRDLSQKEFFPTAGYSRNDKEILERVGREVLPIRISDGVVTYLLILVDQLQDWDRYPIIRTGRASVLDLVEAQDICTRVTGDKVQFRFSRRCEQRAEEIQEDLDKLVRDWRHYVSIEASAR